MNQVLLTGGSGYVGRHVASRLLAAGFNVINIDDFSNSKVGSTKSLEAFGRERFRTIVADVKSNGWHELVTEEIGAVIHFAAYKYNSEALKKPLEYYQNNINTTLTVLEFIRNRGIKSFIFSSSAAVYGSPVSNPVTEDAVLKPSTAYGSSKMICEEIIQKFYESQQGGAAVILRYFNPIGSEIGGTLCDDPVAGELTVMHALRLAASGLSPGFEIFGDDYPTADGTCIRDYIHVLDVADAHVRALKVARDGRLDGTHVVNIGMGVGVSVLSLVNAYRAACGAPITIVRQARRPGDVAAVFGEVSRAQEILRWRASRSIEDACRSDWESWKRRL